MQGKYIFWATDRTGTYMGMSITETVYLSLYLSLVAKKKQKQRKKVQS